MVLLGGQFKSATHGQFKSAQGGQFDRILHNTSFLVPENWEDLRILSDIDGLNRYTYKDNSNKESAVRTACTKIINAIKDN